MKVQEILQRSSKTFGSHTAVIDSAGSLSYTDLHSAAGAVQASLSDHRVPPGSVVGLSLTGAREFLAALFGVLQHDCVAMPISPQLPESERERVINETNVSWSIEADNRGGLIVSQHHVSRPYLARESFPSAAVIRHTSGTTGRSRGVVLSHMAVLARCKASQTLLGVTSSDRVLAPLPLPYHFIASALSFLQAGASILDSAILSPAEMLQLAVDHGATMVYGSPLQYELLSRAPSSLALPNLRTAISTSALLPQSTADLFKRRFGVRLTQVYGVIEVGLPIWNDSVGCNPATLGWCKPPYEARVVRDDASDAPIGELGELLVRGPGLFSGYLVGDGAGIPFAEGEWFHTGDIVSKDESGALTYRGRKKSIINCGGNKVYPEEVEEVLRKHPAVQHVRVVAEPHQLLGSLVVAEIILTPQSSSDPAGWRSLCYHHLSGYKVPKEFRIVGELPVTGSGKIVRATGNEGGVSA